MTSFLPGHGEQKLSPQTILDTNYAFARTAILVASVRLHVFAYLADKALTPVELAACADTLSEPTERLLKGLEALGFVEKEGEAYRLTPIADHFLVEGKPSYLGGDTLAMVDYVPAWFELDRTLRDLYLIGIWVILLQQRHFLRLVIDLFPLIFPIASRIAAELPLRKPEETALQVFDVGAGSAPWSAAFALHYPTVHVTALDLPAVVEQGRQQIASLGLTDRYTWIEADIGNFVFSPLTYDLIFCGHICRFISDERTKALITRLAHSLRPGGILLVADVFLAEDGSGPPPAITLDLSMLVNSADGRIRRASEIVNWLVENGLQNAELFHVTGPFPVVIARKEEGL